MSELLDKQMQFARDVPKLLNKAHALGYDLTIGEVWRAPIQAAANAASGSGISNSLHIDKLAIDINLFANGHYISDSALHAPLGTFWKSLGPDHCWGGDFKDSKGNPKPDGNHYSISYGGRK